MLADKAELRVRDEVNSLIETDLLYFTVWSADDPQGYQANTPYHRDLGEEDEDDLGQPARSSSNSNGHKKKESQSSNGGGYHTIA